MKRNKNGLTLGEWLDAANLGRDLSLRDERRQRQAWQRGQDPVEWAMKEMLP